MIAGMWGDFSVCEGEVSLLAFGPKATKQSGLTLQLQIVRRDR